MKRNTRKVVTITGSNEVKALAKACDKIKASAQVLAALSNAKQGASRQQHRNLHLSVVLPDGMTHTKARSLIRWSLGVEPEALITSAIEQALREKTYLTPFEIRLDASNARRLREYVKVTGDTNVLTAAGLGELVGEYLSEEGRVNMAYDFVLWTQGKAAPIAPPDAGDPEGSEVFDVNVSNDVLAFVKDLPKAKQTKLLTPIINAALFAWLNENTVEEAA
ncbi:hypothetical protein OH491_25980 [Termitidicoccus mucosus]|uniref:Uncharacterized protein n=1 Tax=Termitidicoccus mucosus TaxID=1184151 RepID=A0A178IKC3_9BACT|nr:hypothetical protein AW736_00555 [Opitutaceae bacterium TSB47]